MFVPSHMPAALSRAVKAVRVRRYDRNHRKQALSTVSAIETFNAAKLTPQQKRLADDYAVQAKATLSSDLEPKRSEERATMRPPRVR